jgi:hypothetical protein
LAPTVIVGGLGGLGFVGGYAYAGYV